MIEWLIAFRMFLAFWLCPARYLHSASIWRPSLTQLGYPHVYLAVEFEYVIQRTGHVVECGASTRRSRLTWLRMAWAALREWYDG